MEIVANRPRKALVLGEDVRSLLSVIRSLGRGGVEVHVGWCPADSEALRSRYVARAHRLPAHEPDDRRWISALIALMDREAFDLIMPCSDAALIPLQAHRAELEGHGRIYLLSDEAFRVVSDKIEANRLARSLGINLPKEVVVEDARQIGEAPWGLRLPMVLKPQWSYDRASVGQRRSVRFVETREDLVRSLGEMLASGPVAAQEFFPGRGTGVELLLCDGEPLLEFQHVRLHEPPRGGAGSYRESMRLTPELRQAAVALLRPLRYTGVAMVEFKVDPRTGEWVFIEVNGRFWGSLPLAVAAGADFPMALFRLLVEGRRDFRRDYRVGLRCRNWRNDRWWLLGNIRARRRDPGLPTLPLWKVAAEALASAATLRERSDTFAVDDPGPAVAELGLIARDTWAPLKKRIDRAWLRSAPIRRRLERRARAALSEARTVLFVCYGNICRSPFAEHLARRSLPPDRVVDSAGYHPRSGRICPDPAIVAAARWDVDLHPHRSRRLTEDRVRAADAVFVFDEENRRRVREEYPSVGPRLHLLGALDRRGPLFIEDPYGSDPDVFERVYREIAAALEAGSGPRSPGGQEGGRGRPRAGERGSAIAADRDRLDDPPGTSTGRRPVEDLL